MADSPALVQTYQLYIDGNWVEPADGRYDDISPSTEAVIATAPDASVAQVGDAIAAARRAFDSGPWGTTSAEQRAACLNQLGEALSKHADDFFALSQTEWGCVANERIMQIDGAGFMSMHAAGLATQLTDQEVTGLSAGTTLLRHAPLGVVSVLTPWNFPHCLNVMKLNHALAAGNTVVLKPSPLTPLAGLALARIIDEHTDIPPGVVNVVTPSGVEAAKLLTTDPRIDMVSFTGSSVVGRQVMSAASDTMKRILLELGGKSASIVLDDTEVTDEMLQQMLFDGCSLHAGQACILHSRLLLPDSLHDTHHLRGGATRAQVGDAHDDRPAHSSRCFLLDRMAGLGADSGLYRHATSQRSAVAGYRAGPPLAGDCRAGDAAADPGARALPRRGIVRKLERPGRI